MLLGAIGLPTLTDLIGGTYFCLISAPFHILAPLHIGLLALINLFDSTSTSIS
ncbi:hypothetical protein COCNU_16G000070 [Cocos nucifera]|uniref:Uncharacterized protein n=1 Tax=Cocos nucifera TaxID=13894 RepID=A0A8K0IXI5_COCNU|nr:hypothetical protein COCNU_16G000070 [Cocos nucifera]